MIWLTAAQLEEANGSIHRVDSIIEKAIKSLRNNDVIIDREKWLQHAYNMEKAGAVHTCGAIVRCILEIGVEPEDRRRTWVEDAEKALKTDSIETAKAIHKLFGGQQIYCTVLNISSILYRFCNFRSLFKLS